MAAAHFGHFGPPQSMSVSPSSSTPFWHTGADPLLLDVLPLLDDVVLPLLLDEEDDVVLDPPNPLLELLELFEPVL